MVGPNCGIIIQARMASSRFPGKILMPIPTPHGPSLISHIISRAIAASGSAQLVVLATSLNPENDPLEQVTHSFNIPIYRGDEQNVLSRFTEIIRKYQFEHVARLTADNPFPDPKIIASTIHSHIQNQVDYTRTVGLPVGMNIEVIRSTALLQTARETQDPHHLEHVTTYIKSQQHFKKNQIYYQLAPPLKLRLSIDYPSDYALACEIAHSLKDQPLFGIEEILKIFTDRPWLSLVNSDNGQLESTSLPIP